MKKFNVLFLFAALSIAASAQPQNAKLALKLVPRSSFVTNRDGQNIQVSIDAFYMSNEVTNKEYRAFVNDLKQNPNDTLFVMEWRLMQSGTNKPAFSKYAYSELLKKAIDTTACENSHSFSDPQFDDYPVVGVTRQYAMFYCAWLTQKENEIQKKTGKAFVMDYRLPSEFEWLAAIKDEHKGTSEPQYSKSESGTANNLGLFNLCGNVREWTLSKTPSGQGVVVGTSWNAPGETNSRSELPDTHCDCFTGFRVVTADLSGLKK